MWLFRVRKVGNSNVITLPKELEALGWVPGKRVRFLRAEREGTAVVVVLADAEPSTRGGAAGEPGRCEVSGVALDPPRADRG